MPNNKYVVPKDMRGKILDLGDDAVGGINLLIDLPITADDAKAMRQAAVSLLSEIDKLIADIG